MANIKEQQQEAFATIDTAKVLDKVLVQLQLLGMSLSLNANIATNPIGLLLQILDRLGVEYDTLVNWLTNYMVWVLPSLEMSVKAILLTNLKSMITCTTDPRIPEKYRKQHKEASDYNTSQEYGIDISLESIDYFNKLSISPLGKEGKYRYFGLDEVKDVYKFARAEDFDAFLWFIMHKGRFPNSSKITSMDDFRNTWGATSIDGNSLLESVKLGFTSDNSSKILVGNTFSYKGGSNVISLDINDVYDKDNKIVENTLVPVSDDWNSVNWYTRRGDYFSGNLGIGKKKSRDYNKEVGICNIQFLDQSSVSDTPLTGLINNKFRFTILPRPYIHIPNILQGEPAWRFKKLLFDSNGKYDPNGKYTIPNNAEEKIEGGKIIIRDKITWKNYASIDIKSGSVSASTDIISSLMECYPGLTVFEFNYDYVMGMKLFDAKVMVSQIIDTLTNMRMGLGFSSDFGLGHQEAEEEVKNIIKSIIDSDDVVVDDCFFEFNNDKYDALLKNAERKRANRNDYRDVKEILDEYSDSAFPNEQVEILKRAITQVTVDIASGSSSREIGVVQLNFVTDMIEYLSLAIIYAVLSPKVLMLLNVNQTIMGGKLQKISIKELLRSMRSIVIAIVNEVRDLIVMELWKLVDSILSPLITTLTSAIVREQLESYAETIDDILRNCPSIWFSLGGNQNIETKLDTVDYADIDTRVNKGEEPKVKNC